MTSVRAEQTAGRPHLLPAITAPGLDLIVLGAAPSREAAACGHYYAGRRNRFWQILCAAGFTPTELPAVEDARVLEFGIGLLPMMPYRISVQNDALPPPTEEDRERVFETLKRCAPRFVVYNGRDVYRMLHGREGVWGLQPETLFGCAQFVVHSSSGRADRWAADRLFLWRQLHLLVRSGGPPYARQTISLGAGE